MSLRFVTALALVVALLAVQQGEALATVSATIPDMDWGYVTTDAVHDANMFYWFYGQGYVPPHPDNLNGFAASPRDNRSQFPLVLWLQGGPGASSFFGDLAEFGPLDPFLKPREFSWNKIANLLFFDNPVGTGFSYVAKPGPKNEGFVTNQAEIGAALVKTLTAFLAKNPAFLEQNVPFWIFAESYGPKYATTLALLLHQEISANPEGPLASLNFQGVSLGDGWLSPMDCVNLYADYMYSVSLLNDKEYAQMTQVAQNVQQLVEEGELAKAGNMVDFWVQGPFMSGFWPDIENFVFSPTPAYWNAMNADLATGGAIRKRFGNTIPSWVAFGNQSGPVGTMLGADFLKPEWKNVDDLLKLGYRVNVYEGQFDVVVPITCTRAWIKRLTWDGMAGFQEAPKLKHMDRNGQYAAFEQAFENFSMWNILRAGHMAPMDQPENSFIMFKAVLEN